MNATGYLLVGVFALGPLTGAIVATARSRSHPFWLTLLWLAVIGAILILTALVLGRWNLPQQWQLVAAVMACGVAAWIGPSPGISAPFVPSTGSDNS